jgi:hypothetical protein
VYDYKSPTLSKLREKASFLISYEVLNSNTIKRNDARSSIIEIDNYINTAKAERDSVKMSWCYYLKSIALYSVSFKKNRDIIFSLLEMSISISNFQNQYALKYRAKLYAENNQFSQSFADIHLLAIPGQRHPAVTDYALSSMQTRFDALYIMDVEHKDAQNNFITSSLAASTYPPVNVSYTTTRFTSRGLNNSFGAAYFPDAVMRLPADPTRRARVPASIPVLGAFAQNDALGYAWTAPAGYNRAVLNVEELGTKFLVENVDTVYDAGINPLVAAPGVGPVVNGQRTLLAEGSALDRINVRRLLIEVRRRVRAVANTILFEPNRDTTIARFNAAVAPIMKQVQEQRGVDRYRVQIDTTTTTQADIENNTIRGKIFLQPTKSAEFISVDFEARNAAGF